MDCILFNEAYPYALLSTNLNLGDNEIECTGNDFLARTSSSFTVMSLSVVRGGIEFGGGTMTSS